MPSEQSAAPLKREKLEAYRAAQRRGVEWLLRQPTTTDRSASLSRAITFTGRPGHSP